MSIREEKKKEVRKLIRELREEEKGYLSKEAAWALREIGAVAKEAVPSLIEALKENKEEKVRIGAVQALKNIGGEKSFEGRTW